MRTITATDINIWLAEKGEIGNTTKHLYLTILASFIEYVKLNGYVMDANPARIAKKLVEKRTPKNQMLVAAFKKFLPIQLHSCVGHVHRLERFEGVIQPVKLVGIVKDEFAPDFHILKINKGHGIAMLTKD